MRVYRLRQRNEARETDLASPNEHRPGRTVIITRLPEDLLHLVLDTYHTIN